MCATEIVRDIDRMVGTRRRRHIVGGILVSAGLMIMGLAVTVLTLENNMEEEDENE